MLDRRLKKPSPLRRPGPRSALLGAVSIWGINMVIVKVALAEIGPVSLALLRLAVATALFLPVLYRYFKNQGGTLGSLLPTAVTGILGVTLYFSLQNIGLFYTSAANASLILGSIPVFTLLFSALLLREHISLSRAAGVILSVLGVTIVVLTAVPSGREGGLPIMGNLLVLGSALAWSLYTVKAKELVGRLPQMVVAAGSLTFGFIGLLPLAFLEAQYTPWVNLDTGTWLLILYLGFVPSGAAYFLWNYGLQNVSASEAGIFINLVPIITIVTSAIFLGERVTPGHLAGGALVIGGAYTASTLSQQERLEIWRQLWRNRKRR